MSTDLISQFAAPLGVDSPAGPNLEYDARFIALEEACMGEPEHSIGDKVIPASPPDWRDVGKQATALMKETRDVRVMVIWTIARLAEKGLSGLLEGMEIMEAAAREMWDSLWPVPDDGDVQERISALTRLSPVPGSFDADTTVLHLLLEAPLTDSPHFGGMGLRDLREAREGSDAQRALNAALQDTPQEKVDAMKAMVESLKNVFTSLRELYAEHQQGTPDFRMAMDLLKEMQLFLNSRPQSAPAAPAPAAASEASPAAESAAALPAAPAAVPTPAAAAVASAVAVAPVAAVAAPMPSAVPAMGRQQAVELLQQLCQWFETHEPSSPVPYFLRRAIRCVGANFMDILEDIAPSAREQVRTVLRPDAAPPAAPVSVAAPAPVSAPAAAPAPTPEPAPQEGYFNPFG